MSISKLVSRTVPVKHYVLVTAWLLLSLFLTRVTSQDGQFAIKHVQDPLNDWSSKCVNNAILASFLTLRMGQSDAEVVVISGNYGSYPNCTIEYYSDKGSTTIFTFEFPDMRTFNTNLTCEGIHIQLYENNDKSQIFDVCGEVASTTLAHTSISSTEPLVSISISSTSYFQPFKLTATTARQISPGEKCDPDTEVECVRQGLIEVLQVCMTVEIKCDGHLNCGALGEFDESEKLCRESTTNILWLMVLSVIILFAIVTFFLMRCLHRRIPRVGNNFFVFNEDEDNRLNLNSIYTEPADMNHKHGATLSDSSYKFKTSTVMIAPEDGALKPGLQAQIFGVEMRSESPRKPSVKTENTKATKHSVTTDDRNTKATNSYSKSPLGNEGGRKTHFSISPATVEIIPDYDESWPRDKGAIQTDSARKSILDGEETTEIDKERRKTFKDVRSSKEIFISHRQQNEASTSGRRPKDSGSDSDSD